MSLLFVAFVKDKFQVIDLKRVMEPILIGHILVVG